MQDMLMKNLEFENKNCNQHRLFVHASEADPRPIRSKPTHSANLLAQRIADRWASSEKKSQKWTKENNLIHHENSSG